MVRVRGKSGNNANNIKPSVIILIIMKVLFRDPLQGLSTCTVRCLKYKSEGKDKVFSCVFP